MIIGLALLILGIDRGVDAGGSEGRFHPDGTRVVFSSNMADPRRRNFDLYIINVDGTGLERITTTLSFESWPVFSPDGKKLVFISNRNAGELEETNLFIADWVP